MTHNFKNENIKIRTSKDIAPIMRPLIPENLDHEECWAAYLKKSSDIIDIQQVTVGDLDSVIFDVRRIVKNALLCDAKGVIVCHNHPSGDITPTKSDIKQTETIKKALDLFSLSLVDHIILGEKSYYSFADDTVRKF